MGKYFLLKMTLHPTPPNLKFPLFETVHALPLTQMNVSLGWTSGKFLSMSDTSLSGKMSVLAALLVVMEEQGDKVKSISHTSVFRASQLSL